MVHNTFEYCSKYYVEQSNMKKPLHIYEFDSKIQLMNLKFIETESFARNNLIGDGHFNGGQRWRKPSDEATYTALLRECEEYEKDTFLFNYRYETECTDKSSFWSKAMCDYMNVKKFVPAVMINISPDWSKGQSVGEATRTKVLSKIVEDYLSELHGGEPRYTHASYIIECGGHGGHTHAHVVAHFNPKILKSVETHIRKNKMTDQLMKYPKTGGSRGIIQRPGISRTLLRTQHLIDDKLLYLQEEHKPEGHKNRKVIAEVKELVF